MFHSEQAPWHRLDELYFRIKKAAAWVIEKITGSLPLTITNAVAHAIQKLTRYGLCTQPSGTWNTAITQEGKCVQDGTPTPDAPVDIVTNNGALKVRRQSGLPLGYQMVEWLKPNDAIPITGFKTKSTQEITTVFYRESSASSYLYWSDTATSGTSNTTAYLTSGAGNWRWNGKTYAVNVSSGIKITSVQNKDGVWLNGEEKGSYTNPGEFVSTNDLSLFSYTNTSVRIYSMTIREGETVTLDLVPVQRVLDGVYGFYDKVSGNFYTNDETTFEVGDPIDDPIEIYTDGTPEVLTVSGAQMLDPSTVPDENKYINYTTGTATAPSSGVFRYSGYIPVKEGTKYYFGMTPFIASAAGLAWYSTANPGSYISGMNATTLRNTDNMRATAPAGAKYLRFSWRIGESYDPDWEHSVYVCECDSNSDPIMTAWQPYVTAQTVANIPMLLSVGDYKDAAELISGIKTGRVGIKVLDGTEDWQIGSTSDRPFYLSSSIDDSYALPNTPFCTHFQGVASTVTSLNMPDFTIRCGYVGYERFLYIKYKDLYSGGVNAFKAYLAEQYAAGTPVIVIYPRATETTESMTAYPQLCNELYDTADVTANVSDISVTFTTGEQTTPNPYSQLPIMCNNGELKWNGTAVVTDGTPEVLTVSGINLLDPSTSNIKIGETVPADGSFIVGLNNWRTDYIPIVGGKTYAFWGRKKEDNTISAYNRINWYTADKVNIEPRPSYTIKTVTIATAPSNAAYAILSCAPYNSSAAITRDTFDEFNWMLVESSVEIPYQPYVQPQTVNDLPMLLSVGDYKDEAEIISGGVTRKVGVKVLDGTEKGWTQATTSTGVLRFYLPFDGAATPTGAREQVASTHFAYAAEGQDLGITFLSAQTRVYFIPDDQTMTGTTWKAYLAAQYSAGTPVIVLYPLATETTESITPQPLNTTEGTNIIDSTSNVSPIDVEVEYAAKRV